MEILIRHYLNVEPDQDLDRMLKQCAAAEWIEERKTTLLTNALVKALGGS